MDKNRLFSRVSQIMTEISILRNTPFDIDQGSIEDVYIHLYKIKKLFEAEGINISIEEYEGYYSTDNKNLRAAITNVRAQLAAMEVELLSDQETPGTAELSVSDITKIQSVIDVCRKYIINAGQINEKQKSRLLGRLEKLQIEIHKTRTDLDIALASVREVSDTARQVGGDVKPLIERLKEVWDILTGADNQIKQLPPPPKQLPRPEPEADINASE